MKTKVFIVLSLLLLAVPARAQQNGFGTGYGLHGVTSDGSANKPADFSNPVTFLDYPDNPLDCVNAPPGFACTFYSGHAPGTPYNTGILSTAVPGGYGVNVSLGELAKPWLHLSFGIWSGLYFAMLPWLLAFAGMVFGYHYGGAMLQKWTASGES